MAIEIANLWVAMATVTASASGAGVKPTYAGNSGFTAGAGDHSTAGVYDLTLDEPLDMNAPVTATCKSAAFNAGCAVSRPDQNTVRVSTGLAGVADDTVSFTVMVANPLA